ncbi:MAG: CHAT domain-containing protein [Nostocales cyanobacterium 94392]|nr:CHAT domain-containing protein [Nostocales cyanobacterium 94392]
MQYLLVTLGAFWFNIATLLLISSPVLAQIQNTRQNPGNLSSEFIGTGEPQIQVLQGVKRTEELIRMFQGAKWIFHPNGKFIFVPSETANLRNDLFPITGTYKKIGNIWEFQAERRSSNGASASVDGVIRFEKDQIVLEVTQATNANIARRTAQISQILSKASDVVSQPPKIVQGISVPSFFEISLQGKTEAEAFGTLSATLKILPSYTGDSNPFFVILKTEADDRNGSILWSSFTPVQAGRNELYSKIAVNGSRVRLEVNPSQEFRTDIFWSTLISGQIANIIGKQPDGVGIVKRGTFTFEIQGNAMSGTLEAEGISTFGNPSKYQATFTGKARTENLSFPEEKQQQAEQLVKTEVLPTQKPVEKASGINSPALFQGTWEAESFGTIKLQQQGNYVSGFYTGRDWGWIEGKTQGSRFDFTWQDNTGKGWGFLQVDKDGTTLVGMWGKGEVQTNRKNLVARQIVTSNEISSSDILALKFLGYDLVLQGKCQQAINPLETALAFYKKEGRNLETSEPIRTNYLMGEVGVRIRLSNCYSQLEDYDKLLDNLIDSVATQRLLNQQEYIAKVNREQINLIQSGLSDYIENWRQKLSDDTDRIAALDKGQPLLQKLMRLLVELGSEKEALLVSEKARARAIADLLSKNLLSTKVAGTPPCNGGACGDRHSPVNPNITGISLVTPPTLTQIQEIAKTRNATIVEYALLDADKTEPSQLLIWVVQPTGNIEFRSIDLTKSLNTSIKELVINSRVSIGVGSRGLEIVPTDKPVQKQNLQKLHQILIQPIANLLPTNPDSHVIFVPQGELFLVPFPALQDANNKYLIEKHTILTSPAIQILDLTQQQRSKVQQTNLQNVLVVGNPTMPKIQIGKNIEQLAALPGSEKEAKEVAQFLNTTALTGNQASKTAIVPQLSQARIIHLATHGLLDEVKELGVPGAIALAPSGNGEINDGLLTTDEILTMKLNAELVVLSACNTGLGNITGDGVIGLSRSLIAAGVPSIVVSLWSVPDAPTSDLMTEFYRNWRERKLNKAQALRQAILITMKKHPQPQNWAAFTLIGEVD